MQISDSNSIMDFNQYLDNGIPRPIKRTLNRYAEFLIKIKSKIEYSLGYQKCDTDVEIKLKNSAQNIETVFANLTDKLNEIDNIIDINNSFVTRNSQNVSPIVVDNQQIINSYNQFLVNIQLSQKYYKKLILNNEQIKKVAHSDRDNTRKLMDELELNKKLLYDLSAKISKLTNNNSLSISEIDKIKHPVNDYDTKNLNSKSASKFTNYAENSKDTNPSDEHKKNTLKLNDDYSSNENIMQNQNISDLSENNDFCDQKKQNTIYMFNDQINSKSSSQLSRENNLNTEKSCKLETNGQDNVEYLNLIDIINDKRNFINKRENLNIESQNMQSFQPDFTKKNDFGFDQITDFTKSNIKVKSNLIQTTEKTLNNFFQKNEFHETDQKSHLIDDDSNSKNFIDDLTKSSQFDRTNVLQNDLKHQFTISNDNFDEKTKINYNKTEYDYGIHQNNKNEFNDGVPFGFSQNSTNNFLDQNLECLKENAEEKFIRLYRQNEHESNKDLKIIDKSEIKLQNLAENSNNEHLINPEYLQQEPAENKSFFYENQDMLNYFKSDVNNQSVLPNYNLRSRQLTSYRTDENVNAFEF